MDEYTVFDEYLKKSQSIRDFCEDREKLLFESISIGGYADVKITYLKAVGKEIDSVVAYIDQLKKERQLQSLTTDVTTHP